jgi:hypothetical protein
MRMQDSLSCGTIDRDTGGEVRLRQSRRQGIDLGRGLSLRLENADRDITYAGDQGGTSRRAEEGREGCAARARDVCSS